MSLATFGIFSVLLTGAYLGFKHKDPSIKLGSCFFERLATPLYTLFNEYHSNKGLLVDYIQDDSVILNTPYSTLYGVEICSNGTLDVSLNKDFIDSLIRDYKKQENSYFFYVLHKQGKWQKQYIFSHNQAIIKNISKYFNSRLLSGRELVNIIYDLYLQNSFFTDKKQIKRALEVLVDKEQKEPEFMAFKRVARQALYNSLQEIDLFQAYKNLDVNENNISQLFSLDFDGCVFIYIDLCQRRIENYIQKIINETKLVGNKEPFVQLKNKYSNNELSLAILNSSLFLKRYDESIIGSLGLSLKFSYLKKELSRTQSIQKTPIKYRDVDFDFLVQSDFLSNFITSIHKKPAKEPDIFGLDKNGAFINFSYSGENRNPHSCIIAKPGSGKSVSKQKIMAQMINLDFSTGFASNLGSNPNNVKLRSYDIGFSDENFINFIKSNPKNKVAHIESSLYDFSYNLVALEELKDDADKDDREAFESDLDFMANLSNIILESQNSQALDANEKACFTKTVRTLYIKKTYQRYRLRDIRETHREIYDELLSLSYEDSSFLMDIKEKEYSFLKKPLLMDVIKYAKVQAENRQIKEEERNSYGSLASKLLSIDSLGIFSIFDKVDIKEADVLSMDLNNFKESSLFTPIFFCIFQKTYLKDRDFALKCKRLKKSSPKLFYAIEEAKNFFRDNKTFEEMFEKVTLEARKYNVHLCFIVQSADHIPKCILKQLDTKMFLLSPENKLEVIEEVILAFGDNKRLIEAISNTEQYELCVAYSAGIFHMKFEISDEELALFNTNPNEV